MYMYMFHIASKKTIWAYFFREPRGILGVTWTTVDNSANFEKIKFCQN